MIDVEQLCAGYRDRTVLHEISFQLERGLLLSVVGPNGCGKTTLLRALAGLLPASGGSIRYAGKPRGAYRRKEFARLCAFLPQTREIPEMTVREFTAHGRYPHLTFGQALTRADREQIELAMQQARVAELADRPLGELSGGQRQRAYLAMTLAQDAAVLLLDEPTTYLDIGQKLEMMELLTHAREWNKTMIAVLHDLPLALQYSDRIAVLQEGKLAAFGTSEEVLSTGAIERAFGVACHRAEVQGSTQYFFLPKEKT